MRTKNLLFIVFAAIVVFNTLFGAMIDGYEMDTCMLVNLSLILTAGLFYWLYASWVSNALKITISFVLALTGLIRMVLMLCGTENGIILAFVGILLLEVVIMALAYYNSSK